TNGSGKFHQYLTDSGNYSHTPDPINYYNIIPGSHTSNFSGFNQIDSLNDFAVQPAGPINDLCVTITPTGNFRSGFNASYMINYFNYGTTTLNPTVLFLPDNNISYVSSSPTATTISTDTIQWVLGTIAPFQSGTILVTINVSTGLPIGTLINSAAIIEPIAGDVNPGSNTAYWEILTTGSFDPNDIRVNRYTLNTTEFPNPPYLEYIVRFQNKGNDTAFFVNIRNNISPLLDVNTFEVIATSHNASVEYSTSSRLMTYKFENILLPHSAINEPASHGFIRYKIKPVDSLVVGDQIKNQASIFFDYNEAILTNIATTTVVLPVGETELIFEMGKLNLFPNPTKDEINIVLENLKGQTITLELYSIYGQKISSLMEETIQSDHIKVNHDVSNLSKGIYFIRLQTQNGMWMSRFVKM
ncbi:MAG TPA: T9SS type A sorting domain-containing protein, partial [Bacteroidia bacterium]|nr:T9SS type A sorting domain-containing protein [Bacteroidia bacterium]